MNPAQQVVGELLAMELAQLESFAQLLEREQAVLQAAQADQLPAISSAKEAAAAELGKLMQRRESALAILGHGAGRAGMSAWLAGLPPDQQAGHAVRWQSLLDAAERCRATHSINGKLIAIQLAHTQQALNALMTAGGQSITYGPDGQQRLGGSGRSLGTA